jgi:hypothetical protein
MRHVVGDRLKFLLLALLLLHIYRCLLACTSLAPELARSKFGRIFQRFPQSIGVTFAALHSSSGPACACGNIKAVLFDQTPTSLLLISAQSMYAALRVWHAAMTS